MPQPHTEDVVTIELTVNEGYSLRANSSTMVRIRLWHTQPCHARISAYVAGESLRDA